MILTDPAKKFERDVRREKNKTMLQMAKVESMANKLASEISALQSRATDLQNSGKSRHGDRLAFRALKKDRDLKVLNKVYENLEHKLSYLESFEDTAYTGKVLGNKGLNVDLPRSIVKGAEKWNRRQEREGSKYVDSGSNLQYVSHLMTPSPVSHYGREVQEMNLDMSLQPSFENSKEFNDFLRAYKREMIKVESSK
jgi:mRNA-degrading endonuclease YafQ of YafQ-DinJ toxin-antitoxin module